MEGILTGCGEKKMPEKNGGKKGSMYNSQRGKLSRPGGKSTLPRRILTLKSVPGRKPERVKKKRNGG